MSNCVNLRVFHGGNFINKDNEFNYNNGSVHDGIEIGIAKFRVKKCYAEVRNTLNLRSPLRFGLRRKE